ncbi:MAG: hypothetical protein WD872_00675 [Pirellulaceae bacterium]
MVSAFCLCAALLVADPAAGTPESQGTLLRSVANQSTLLRSVAKEVPHAARPFHEIRAEIQSLLKSEAQAAGSAARAAPLVRMCALHGELLADSRYESSDTLQEYRGRLWSRLRRVKDKLKRELVRSSDPHDVRALSDQRFLEQADPGLLSGLGGGGVVLDSGPDLVDLIERTINPAFWDVHGGPGTIVYYAPLRCLVVRATGQTHEKIGGAIGGLRKAGK